MRFPRFLRNLLAALAFSLPNFTRGKDEAAEKETDANIEREQTKLKPGGGLEEVKYYGRTIAGGPGSQKIGDTFDALPDYVRQNFIRARGRGIGPAERAALRAAGRMGATSMVSEFSTAVRSADQVGGLGSMDRLTRGINRALADRYKHDEAGKITPKDQ